MSIIYIHYFVLKNVLVQVSRIFRPTRLKYSVFEYELNTCQRTKDWKWWCNNVCVVEIRGIYFLCFFKIENKNKFCRICTEQAWMNVTPCWCWIFINDLARCSDKVLLIHAGGFSKRLPIVSVIGKIFAALPFGKFSTWRFLCHVDINCCRGSCVYHAGDETCDLYWFSFQDETWSLLLLQWLHAFDFTWCRCSWLVLMILNFWIPLVSIY